MIRCLGLLVVGAAVVCGVPCAKPQAAGDARYDLVLRNGKIIDGTGNPWYRGDVAVRGKRIVAIGEHLPGPAKRTIDAKGLVVAPGFIDIHSHSDYHLLEDGTAQSKIRQGVTTEVFGEGNSAGPYVGKLMPRRVRAGSETLQWHTLGDYFDTVEKRGVSVNVASFVGLSNIWRCVLGESHARPTPKQLDEMKKLIDDAMRQGASGLSCLLAMPPGSLATTDELVELCKVVAKHGGVFVAHIRHEGTDVFDAVREVIEVGRRAGVRVEILHLKIADQRLWGKMTELVQVIAKARAEGVNVQANVYPYTRGHNNLASIVPPWAHEGGTKALLDRLKDPRLRDRLKKEIREGVPGWYDHYTAVGGDWSRVLLTGNTTYGGLTMDRVLAGRVKKQPGTDLLDAFLDFLRDEGGSVPAIYEHHAEKDMQVALRQPWVGIGSDGLAHAIDGPLRRGHPHPRSFGTFPRVLGVYARDLGLLRLEDAVRRMTSMNARKLGLTDRGLLRPGAAADVTVFDAARVIDRATYTEPFRYSEGVEYVLVNGTLVLDRGKHTGARPGVALRHGL
jgi:N-acyl-D-aspartate/D-glutamate deacylase